MRRRWFCLLFTLLAPAQASAARQVDESTRELPTDPLAAVTGSTRVEQASAGALARETFARETFRITAINTGEFVDVEHREGEATAASRAELFHLFRCMRTQGEREIDPRLVDLLARISKEAGQPIELVSGYRAPLWPGDHSFHVRGEAADIRVPGMTTLELRALVNALDVPGVGYYPTSKMIHVDVRERRYRWTDWSGPAGGTK